MCDVALNVGGRTVTRINGELVPFGDLDASVVKRTILALLTAEQEKSLIESNDPDFSFALSNGARQRVNVFRQNGRLAASIRLLNDKIPTLDELKMPQVVTELAKRKRGLFLVTGPTGSGKSTTLSAVIDNINRNRACHIITIEDPIEYCYTPIKATIHQREVGRDVASFNAALKSALREDPDVIPVGEMRDYETISLAMTAAETGHLVLATLHTSGAAQTIDRIIDACPVYAQEQVRARLSTMPEGIIAQTLVPAKDSERGRVAVLEILPGTDAVRNLIRTNKLPQLNTVIRSSARQGMCTINDSLAKYYKRDVISYETAMEFSNDKTELEKTLNAMSGFGG